MGEIVAALGLISVVSLSVISLFSYLAVSSQTRSERAPADLLASSLMESASTTGPPHWGLEAGQLNDEVTVEVETGDAQAKERLTYQVTRGPTAARNGFVATFLVDTEVPPWRL